MPAHDEMQLDGWIQSAISAQNTPSRRTMSLEDCAAMAQYAAREAQAIGIPMVFSLANACGHQRYFFSMEEALLVSHRLATEKAWTAVALKMATHELAMQIQPGEELYGLQQASGICCIGGGLPCWSDGVLLGAIGVSGGTVEQDLTVARNTLRRFSAARYAVTPSR
ncbi:GlcG/HbpS family heme-binding protein [Rahnella selenatireducens]|uniref:GlcG/HbpS family heme-binding protein n=1 Tax=Rahnella selenatireducens TaxID=3389797 RepID=UPI003969B95B